MNRLLTTIAKTHAALHTIRTSAHCTLRTARRRDQRGSVSLEQVIVAVGLAALAGVIIAALGVAVAKYTGKL